MSDQNEEEEGELSFIERMDRLAERFLDKAERADTSYAERVKCFDRALAWGKQRAKLVPKGSGAKLKEMSDGLKGGGRKGNSGSAASGSSANTSRAATSSAKDGKAIRRIIDSLPSYGDGPRGDPTGAERARSGLIGIDGGAGTDGVGDDDSNADGTVHGAVV